MPPLTYDAETVNIVAEHDGEPYALIVDNVGDMLPIDECQAEAVPAVLDPQWRAVGSAVLSTEAGLTLLLARLLDLVAPTVR
jgi:purine-binding chemotaxis protein CheW